MTQIFATGIRMGESPRWHDGRFWMCDWMAGEVLAFDADGTREVVARVEGLPFSIDWLPDGRVVTTTPAGVVVGTDLAPYGAAGVGYNEIVVDDAGRAWVDQPGSMPWEERKAGVDRLSASTITADGSLADRRVWADLGPGSAPDGICADAEGATWYAPVPGERCVRVAEGGEVLETVEADRGCFSCVLGGEDGHTLFVTANHYSGAGASDGVVLTARVDVPARR